MSVIGSSSIRTDSNARIRGEECYAIDYCEPGMLHGAILRSPVAAGSITRLDVAAARRMPGVRAVASASDAPEVLAGWVLLDTPLFARGQVRYAGEPVAAVAADTIEQARAALEAIVLEIAVTPPVVDLRTARSSGSPLVHPDWRSYLSPAGLDFQRDGNIASQLLSVQGDVDGAFAGASLVVEDEFESGRQYQGYLEAKSAVGIWRDGRYQVHTGHQYPFNVRDRIAQFLQVSPSSVRVICHAAGGGFGGRLDYGLEPYAVLLSRLAQGRPVKIVNSRTEDIETSGSRDNSLITIRSALDAAGNIVARELQVDLDNGAYTGEMALMPSVSLLIAAGAYRVGAARVTCRLVYTNTPPTGAFRGVSGVAMYTAVERHMDHIARELGEDRRDFRLRHLFRSGDALLNGQVLDDADILRAGFEAMEKTAPWAAVSGKSQPYRGVGIAAAVWITNATPASVTIKLNEDGTVGVLTGASDIGTGAFTMGVTQIVAEVLGIRPQDVRLSQPDTDVASYDIGSQGSRTTRMVGGAAQNAALEVRSKILHTAGQLLQAQPEELELVGGRVRKAGDTGPGIALSDVALANTWGEGPITGTGRYADKPVAYNQECAKGLVFSTFPTPTYHVHLAEVEVDPVTGNVRVVRYVVVQEVGRMINPAGVVGQIQGGVSQGIGFTLYESLRLEQGRVVEKTLEAYRLPLAVDLPDVEIVIMEHPSVDGPHGAKGVAEPPIVLVPAVIGNAIADAIGKAINKTPITPEDVLAALREAQA